MKRSLRALCLGLLFGISTALPLAAQDAAVPPSGKRENLGPNINSEADESVPVLSPDGRTLYFLREVPGTREGQEQDKEIFFSTIQPDGSWSKARSIGEPLNTWDWNFMLSILPDGNTALLSYVYDKDGSTRNGFSISRRTARGWGFPEPVVIDNYKNNNKYVSAFLASDGRTLLLGVEPDDSYGDLDLYVSFLQENGHFSKPMNIGDDVNTSESDGTPFLAADGVTLYFSSPGHGGYGNDDILMTRRLDDSWTNWSKPVNLGATINTPEFDAYYTISAAGDYAYLVSYDDSYGGSDLFRIPIPKALRPNPVVLVSGKAFDATTKQPIQAEIHYELLPEGAEAGTATATPNEGYKVTLPAGKRYGVRAEARGYYAINDNLDLTGLTEYKEERRDLYLAPIKVGTTVRLNNIFFETGKWDLKPESYPELNRVVKLLTDNEGVRISIDGYTDNVGSDSDNLLLSKNRAKAVLEYLITQGVNADRLKSNGFGEGKPVASNDTEEGRQLNRRVEFTIMAQ